jgi:hypothetical protein
MDDCGTCITWVLSLIESLSLLDKTMSLISLTSYSYLHQSGDHEIFYLRQLLSYN